MTKWDGKERWDLLEGVIPQLKGVVAGHRDAPASLPTPSWPKSSVRRSASTRHCPHKGVPVCQTHRDPGGLP